MNMFSQICSQFFTTGKTMDRQMFDNVKYEKTKAMARFNMFRKMKNILQVFELLVLLLLISWSTNKIPSAAKFSGKVFSELKVILESPLVVFVIVNLIMLALFVLRKQNESVTESGDGNLYDEYDQHGDHSPKSVTSRSVKVADSVEKFIPLQEDDKGVEKVEAEMQIVVHNEKCDAVEAAIAEAAKKIRRFERTQSEKLRREIGVRKNKELRRSETENNRLVVRDGGGTVDHLSNEEFKLAVDDFINKHRVFFKQQKMAEF